MSRIGQNPLVSICIPTYNGVDHLDECIASILAQTFQDFEVVLCDDNSSDGTLDRARWLAAEDVRFRFIPNPKRFGLVGNWNNCIKQAKGEWIKFVFQDDVISPACLERLLTACQQTGRSFGFCERDFIFEEGVSPSLQEWFIGHKQKLFFDYQNMPVIEAGQAARLAIKLPSHNLVGEPTVTLIKRSVLDELGGFDEALIQLCDAEFWCRIMINKGAVFVPESLAAFRIHAKATTSLNMQKRLFRKDVLDPLVLRFRFAFGKYFSPVRDPKRTGKNILSLRKECAMAISQVWQQALHDDDLSLMREWQSLKKHCPGLQFVAWAGTGIELLGRVKRGIIRQIFF